MNGVVLIDKEKGISSFGVVSKVRKILNIKKVGHCGTLDPNATGLLPILIGNATKVSKYLIEHDKTYIATLKLGIKTTTGDEEGEIIQKEDFVLDKNKEKIYIEKIKAFIGKSKQVPPIYSAIKLNGKKLYEYARENKEVKLEERDIEIYNLDIKEIDYVLNEIKFEVSCSKGTYIRSLCEDIANALGTVGFMKDLKRTIVDYFNIKDAITLDKLEQNKDNIDFLNTYIISLEQIFKEKEQINLEQRKKELFLNGVKLNFDLDDGLYRIYFNNIFIGLGVVENKLLKRDVIIEENR